MEVLGGEERQSRSASSSGEEGGNDASNSSEQLGEKGLVGSDLPSEGWYPRLVRSSKKALQMCSFRYWTDKQNKKVSYLTRDYFAYLNPKPYYIVVNDREANKKYPSNYLKTAKYSWYSPLSSSPFDCMLSACWRWNFWFLPILLQFRKLYNCYFLMVLVIQFLPGYTLLFLPFLSFLCPPPPSSTSTWLQLWQQ